MALSKDFVIPLGEKFTLKGEHRHEVWESEQLVALVQYGYGRVRAICVKSYNRVGDIDIPTVTNPKFGCTVEAIEKALSSDGNTDYTVHI